MIATRPMPPIRKLAEPDPLDPAMVLTHADVASIARLCRQNILSQADLMKAITNLGTVSVEGVQVTLEPRLLQRLKSRCLIKDGFPGWLRDVVIRQLHDYAGY
jgi:hypothetical protein